jgi:hypothetical protein
MGPEFPCEMVVSRVCGLRDVPLAVMHELEYDGPEHTPAVVRHDLGAG